MLFRSLKLTQEKTEALSPETSEQEACGSSKKASCMLSRTKAGLLGPKIVPGSLYLHDSSHRQHYSGCLYKQGGRHEVEPIVCTSVEKPDLVLQEASDSQGLTHSRLCECGSRQATKTKPNDTNRVVCASRDLSIDMHQVASSTDRPICNEVQ